MKSLNPHFRQPSKSTERQVEKILSMLTLDEKITLLGGEEKGTVEIPGKFPKIRFADGPVGVHWWCEKSTAYPALIQLAASWDVDLSRRMGEALGLDCRARGVHLLLAPGVNIYRAAFCGRNFEYLGEDPVLASRMVVPYIEGVQDQGVVATVKHFALNNQEFDRHNVSSDADERTLREIYLPAFHAAVTEAGAGAVMTSYNLVNGRHASENDWLIRTILKGEWAFDGVVMSDWVSVYSVAGPVQAGLDLEMPFGQFMNSRNILPLLEKGIVTEEMINDKVRRIIRLAVCFGWLDHPQQDFSIPLDNPKSISVALDVARSGSVLLKNDGILPLDLSASSSIAVIGYHAGHPVICGGGSAYTPPYHTTTLLEALKMMAPPACKITYAAGTDPERSDHACESSRFFTRDGNPGLEVEYFPSHNMDSAPLHRDHMDRVRCFWEYSAPKPGLSCDGFSARWSGKIMPEKDGPHLFYLKAVNAMCKVFLDDALTLSADEKTGGSQTVSVNLNAGKAVAIRIEAFATNTWKMLTFGWEYAGSIAQEREEAVALARQSDLVILSLGYTKSSEGEGGDRNFQIPQDDWKLVDSILGLGKKVIAVVFAGGNIEMASWIGEVNALLYAWYPGQEGGTALAEILTGKVNPSGKLPATFEVKPEDRSSFHCYWDENGDKRVQYEDGIFCGYRHVDRSGIKPLFPFGFGLSYTEFVYSDLRLSSSRMKRNGKIRISFILRNSGKRDGSEVCQLYVADPVARLPRPLKELKAFSKVFLKAGESRMVHWEIDRSHLQYFDPDQGKWVVETGEFRVLIGSSSADIRLEAGFWLV